MVERHRVIVLFNTLQAVLKGVVRYSRQFGPWEFFHQIPFYRQQPTKQQLLKRMKAFRPDGIIAHLHTKNEFCELVPKGIPAVISLHSGEQITDEPNVINIQCDDDKISQIGADYFIAKGFTRFAYCGYESSIKWSFARQKGFCDYLKDKGYTVNTYRTPPRKSMRAWENEKSVLIDWLQSLKKPAAILACNDDRAKDVVEACRITNIAVPEDIAVLGVGNHEITCELHDIPLSSIQTNREKAGFEAAKILSQLINKEQIDQDVVVIQPTHVIDRQSTNILAVEDSTVAQALQYIRDNSSKILQVADVVHECAISRRSLERRFLKSLHYSINQEIRRVKIKQICEMLINTHLSISQIASNLGFMNLDYMSRFFRSEMKIGPRAYRKKMTGYI